MQSLYDRYRPTTWAEVIGQPAALRQVELLRDRGLGGRAFWISGKSGTGKTTIARLLAAELADEFCIEELDASELTPAALREIERSMHCRGIGKGGRAYLLNEAHGTRKDTIRQLLVMLERLPAHVVWVFTTTAEGEADLFDDCIDASPLLSRCIELRLNSRQPDLAAAFAVRAQEIAIAENLDGQPLSAYTTLAYDCQCNFRRMLQKIESGCMRRK